MGVKMRHPYSTNSEERKHVPFYLAILAVVSSLGLAALFRKIGWTPPLWVDFSSIMGLYGLLYGFFKGVAWKWGWLRSLVSVSTPILAGTWSGTVQSDYDGVTRPAHNVEAVVGQDWTEMVIRLIGPNSKSHSLSASMVVTEDECILIYDYLNEPNAHAAETMHMHRGTARLVLTGTDKLEGDYYTGRDRNNIGTIKLRRKN
jgi:hypothetical protein